MAELTLFCFFMVFYAYFGYPLLLLAFNLRRTGRTIAGSPPPAPEAYPPLTVIITVRNEEKVLRAKLEETLQLNYGADKVEALLQQPASSVQLIVASDASDDATDDIVREFASRGVELVRLRERGGKERAQREAVSHARGELIVFTDAKISLNAEALNFFAAYFTSPEVGAVSSIDRVESAPGESSGEGFYVRYEMWLRSLESHFLSLVGLSGSCFGVRKSLCADLAVDVPSDFALLLRTRQAGLRGVHAPQIAGSYRAVKTEKEEFTRKVRTVLRGISTMFARREVLNPLRFGVFSWQVWSHKPARWLVPWFFTGGCAGSFVLAAKCWWFLLISAGLVVFFALALLGSSSAGWRQKTICKVPLFFFVSNSAVALAGIKFLLGQRTITWDPSAKGS